VGHYRPKLEAKRDDFLGQSVQNVVRRHQYSILDLRHLRFGPSRHPKNVPFLKSLILKVVFFDPLMARDVT
jgi:hypothetical protein